jgi:ABC-2 type transport system permease protein
MKSYQVAIKNELYKLIHRRKTKWLIGIILGLSVIGIIGIFIIQNLTSTHVVNASELATWLLQLMDGLILPLFVTMMTIDLFTGELGNETIKNTLLMPINRSRVYLAKITTVAIAIVGILLGMFIVNVTVGTIFFGVSSMTGQLLATFLAYLLTSIPLILISILAAMIGLSFKSSSSALTFSIVLYVALKTVGLFVAKLSIFMPTSYMEWYRYPLTSNTSTQMLLFMVAYIIMFISLGILRFDTKEI